MEHHRFFKGSRIIGPVCKGETVGKVREMAEMGERELVLVVSVRCGKGRDMTRGRHVDDNCLVRHNDAQSLSLSHAFSRGNCDHAVQLCTCCICGCTVHKCKGFLKNLHGGLSHACSRDDCDHAVQLCTCCICGCTVHTLRRLAGFFFSPINRNLSQL